MNVKFVAVLKSITVRAGFLAVTLDLDEANAERSVEVVGLVGIIDMVKITKGQGGVKDNAFLESTSVLPSNGRRFVFAFPRGKPTDIEPMLVGSQALESMVNRQVVVEIKKHTT